MNTPLTIRNSIPSPGRLRAGLYRLLRRTGNSWNTPAPPVIRISKGATCSPGHSTVRGGTVRRSQHQHLDGNWFEVLPGDTLGLAVSYSSDFVAKYRGYSLTAQPC